VTYISGRRLWYRGHVYDDNDDYASESEPRLAPACKPLRPLFITFWNLKPTLLGMDQQLEANTLELAKAAQGAHSNLKFEVACDTHWQQFSKT